MSKENNLAFTDTFRYLWFASGGPVMQITGFAVYDMVAIVQLVRTPGCGPGGRGFKSHWSPKRIVNFEFKTLQLTIQNFSPLSSRGLGHGLFKPGTRVRISLGALQLEMT